MRFLLLNFVELRPLRSFNVAHIHRVETLKGNIHDIKAEYKLKIHVINLSEISYVQLDLIAKLIFRYDLRFKRCSAKFSRKLSVKGQLTSYKHEISFAIFLSRFTLTNYDYEGEIQGIVACFSVVNSSSTYRFYDFTMV